MDKINPTIIVVFGATGDLFRKKIAPALLNLSISGQLPKFFRIVAFSRRAWIDEHFRKFSREALNSEAPDASSDLVEAFLEKIYYVEGDFGQSASYQKVSQVLARLDKEAGVCANKIFYLATPPSFYETILNNISLSGLSIPCAPSKNLAETGWTRILIEKPFGSDLENAKKIDKMLGRLFTESQIFRIDHYLAKETVQNIIAFRFANAIFEPVWNGKYIDRVEVKLYEKGTVGTRGASYDAVGALRDVGQNHVLQMLALVVMENPIFPTATALRKKRAEVLKKFKIWTGKGAEIVRGQYDSYQGEAGVAKNSETETYFKVKLALPNKRFQGVPFIIESGKGLSESKVEISIYFKQAEDGMCPAGICPFPGNIITIAIQPNETISLMYWEKEAGLDFALESKEMVLMKTAPVEGASTLGAYERVLVDGIRGDQTLFTSTEEVLAEWKIVHDIFNKWQKSALLKYPKGEMPEIEQ